MAYTPSLDNNKAHRSLIIAFDLVAIFSSLFMVLMVIAAWLSPYIHRTKAWYSMCISFAVFPLFYLVNAAHQFRLEQEPPIGMCLFQATLIYGGPPTIATAVLCYVLDVALGLHSALFNKPKSAKWAFRLLYIPSVILLMVWCISIMTLTSTDAVAFEASHMFCTAGVDSVNAKIAASLVAADLLAMIGIKVWIIIMIVKNWSAFRSVGNTNKDLRLSVFVRFGIFSVMIWAAGGLAAAIILTRKDTGPTWNILLVTVPFIGGLAFGTHKEIAKTWLCWIRRRPLSSIESPGFYLPATTTGKD
ncbi:hypothetical protein BDZ89DRAFT_1071294 [Hymenopellis radicata]|nr:hypothetical protein BDZ89DRAFT_1071294 [Hymenopellis radicata]